MIVLETAHVGFNFPTLRHSLQSLLNRKRLVDKGNLQPDVVPLVRIPPYTRERNAWVIKQTLDAGPFGLVLPHLDSVDGGGGRGTGGAPGWPRPRPPSPLVESGDGGHDG